MAENTNADRMRQRGERGRQQQIIERIGCFERIHRLSTIDDELRARNGTPA
jgi:hypothetical protein